MQRVPGDILLVVICALWRVFSFPAARFAHQSCNFRPRQSHSWSIQKLILFHIDHNRTRLGQRPCDSSRRNNLRLRRREAGKSRTKVIGLLIWHYHNVIVVDTPDSSLQAFAHALVATGFNFKALRIVIAV